MQTKVMTNILLIHNNEDRKKICVCANKTTTQQCRSRNMKNLYVRLMDSNENQSSTRTICATRIA